MTPLSNDQSPSLSQSRTSILLAVSLIRPKAIDIIAAAPTSLPSAPSQTTRLTTRALPLPRLRRSNETLPAFLAATSSDHCASVGPTSPNGRILDPLTHIATQPCPNLRSHPLLHPRSHGSRIDPRVDHDPVTAEGVRLGITRRLVPAPVLLVFGSDSGVGNIHAGSRCAAVVRVQGGRAVRRGMALGGGGTSHAVYRPVRLNKCANELPAQCAPFHQV